MVARAASTSIYILNLSLRIRGPSGFLGSYAVVYLRVRGAKTQTPDEHVYLLYLCVCCFVGLFSCCMKLARDLTGSVLKPLDVWEICGVRDQGQRGLCSDSSSRLVGPNWLSVPACCINPASRSGSENRYSFLVTFRVRENFCWGDKGRF